MKQQTSSFLFLCVIFTLVGVCTRDLKKILKMSSIARNSALRPPWLSFADQDDVSPSYQMEGWSDSCAHCESRAIFRCRTCQEDLCVPCELVHRSGRENTLHNVVRRSNNLMMTASPAYEIETTSTYQILPDGVCILQRPSHPNVCNMHLRRMLAYCQNCSTRVCGSCVKSSHNQHHIVHASNDDLEYIKTMQMRFENRIRSAYSSIKFAIQRNKVTQEIIQKKTRQVIQLADKEFDSFELDLNSRKDDLKMQAEDIERIRFNSLHGQLGSLSSKMSDLDLLLVRLHEACNGEHEQKLLTKFAVSEKLKEYENLEESLKPCEGDDIQFIPTQINSIKYLGSFGTTPSKKGNLQHLFSKKTHCSSNGRPCFHWGSKEDNLSTESPNLWRGEVGAAAANMFPQLLSLQGDGSFLQSEAATLPQQSPNYPPCGDWSDFLIQNFK